MDGMATLTFILAVFIGLSSVAIGKTQTKDENCVLLERAISDYILGTQVYGNFLYYTISHDDMISEQDATQIMETSDLDLRDPADVHTIACELTAAKRRDDVTKLFGSDRAFVDQLYTQVLAPVKAVGSVSKVLEVGSVFVALLEWAGRNGYPILPLKIDEEDTMKTFTKVHEATEKDYINRYINTDTTPFPLNMTPKEAVTLLKEPHSYSELDKAMNLNPGMLEQWAEFQDDSPSAITGAITDIKVSMAFLDALHKTGILFLD